MVTGDGVFQFHRADPVSRDLDDIIDPAQDPDVAIFVDHPAVSREEEPLELREVSALVPFMIPIAIISTITPAAIPKNANIAEMKIKGFSLSYLR